MHITIPDGAVCGRIIRGHSEEDFLTLSDDKSRRVVMLMADDGLQLIKGKTTQEALPIIGYDPKWVEHLIAQGTKFRLVTFRGNVAAKLATWGNIVEVVSAAYPEIGDRLRFQQKALERFCFETVDRTLDVIVQKLVANGEPAVSNTFSGVHARLYEDLFRIFEGYAKYNFLEVQKLGADDGRYMTLERYLATPAGLAETRAFLYFSCHLRELFAGDGYTRTPDGKRGLREFIAPNAPLDQIGAHDMQDLTL